MNRKLLLHPKTKTQLANFITKPAHGVLIIGQQGSGKETLAYYLASELLNYDLENLSNHSYFYSVDKPDDKKEISIDIVRKLIEELKLKPVISSGGSARRIILINQADNLSAEAQNALLKAVEEPPEGTVFILTSGSEGGVLPTIASRVQKIAVFPIPQSAATNFYKKDYPEKRVDSAWSLSQGAAGLLNALLQNDNNHPLKAKVEDAKKMLALQRYQRVLFIENYSTDKNELLLFLDALSRILSALHHSAVTSGSQNQQKLIKSRKLVSQTINSINNSASARLAGFNLVLKLPV